MLVTTLCLRANGYARDRLPLPTLLTPPTLERVLKGLHDSEIRCGVQNEPPAGGITAWIDFGSRTEKATFYGTIVGDRQVWPAADRMAAWLHKTALRLFPESPYAEERSAEEADEACQRLARSRRRRFASCASFMMRPAASRSDGSPSATWARSKPTRPAAPTRLKGIGSSFPAACTR
jgi:hypothetical protein